MGMTKCQDSASASGKKGRWPQALPRKGYAIRTETNGALLPAVITKSTHLVTKANGLESISAFRKFRLSSYYYCTNQEPPKLVYRYSMVVVVMVAVIVRAVYLSVN